MSDINGHKGMMVGNEWEYDDGGYTMTKRVGSKMTVENEWLYIMVLCMRFG